MGQSTPFSITSSPSPNYIVGRDVEGHWIVRDTLGLTGGLFVSKNAAVRYACFEAEHRPNAVLFVPENTPLSLSGAIPRLAPGNH